MDNVVILQYNELSDGVINLISLSDCYHLLCHDSYLTIIWLMGHMVE
jgi:hypothetical protein